MLPVALHDVSFRHRSGFAISDVTLDFAPGTHTAIVGASGAGASTLLRLIAGELVPDSGDVVIGDRIVNRVRASKRPVIFAGDHPDVPGRWAVDHALVAALRQRSLDRIDRQREFQLAVERWGLQDLLRRRADTLSSTEGALVNVARIELMRPAVLLADRILAGVNPALRLRTADDLYRSLRVSGTTVISVPADHAELAFSERVVVLDAGRVLQSGASADVWMNPVDDRAAQATGRVNVIPIRIRGTAVESPIGNWELETPPFQGTGVALFRPSDFEVAKPGEESDFVFSIEEAGFSGGRWRARGLLSGGITLQVELPQDVAIRKGRLLALRFRPSRVTLVQRALELPQMTVPTDVIPSMRDSR